MVRRPAAAPETASASESSEWPANLAPRRDLQDARRSARRMLSRSAAAARRSPSRALPALAALTVTGAAGCSISPPPSGLEKQIVQGEHVAATTRAHAAPLASARMASTRLLPSRGHVPGKEVTAIGDSVMSASVMALQSALPGIYIDAQPDRQMPAGLDLIRSLARTGRLRPVVVMGLGTNYIVTTGELRQLMRLIGPERRLVLINTYVPDQWSEEVNAVEAAFIRQHPAIVSADWYDTIKDRMSLLWPDHVHPQMPGTVVYARMVYRSIQAIRHNRY